MNRHRARLSNQEKREVVFQLALRGGRVDETVPHVELERAALFDLKKASIKSGLYSEIEAEIEPLLRKRRQGLAYKFLDGIEAAIDAFAGKIPAASLKDTAVAIGIMTDKLLLLSGEPTERTETTSHVTRRNFNLSAELDARMDRIFDGVSRPVGRSGGERAREVDIVA